MTFAETADRYAPKSEDIIGPYSPWPRRRERRGRRVVAYAFSAAVVGFALNFGVPVPF